MQNVIHDIHVYIYIYKKTQKLLLYKISTRITEAALLFWVCLYFIYAPELAQFYVNMPKIEG